MSITSMVLRIGQRLRQATDKLAGLAPLLIRITVGSVFITTAATAIAPQG